MTTLTQPGAGTNGAAVTTSNCTSGNQWDTIAKSGTGTTQTFDNVHSVHGSATATLSHVPGLTAAAHYDWKAAIPGATANAYARLYLYVTANPSVGARQVAFFSGSGTISCILSLQSAGTLRILNSASAVVATTTNTVALNAWNRIEFDVTAISGSTGNVAARLYKGANLESATPTETISGSGVAVTGTVNEVRYGVSVAAAFTSAWDEWLQDFAWSDTVSPGPALAPVTPLTVATTWNVRTPVVKTTATTWNVRGVVAAKTVASTWNVRTSVAKTVASTWRVRQAVTATTATTWRVRSVVGAKTVATTWNVRQAVTRGVSTTWHVRSAVTVTTATTWNVRGLAVTTTATTWDVRQAVARSVGTTWNVRVVITPRTVTTRWNVAVAVVGDPPELVDITGPYGLTVTAAGPYSITLTTAGPYEDDAIDLLVGGPRGP